MDEELVFGAFGWEWKKSNIPPEILESRHYDDCLKPCPFCGYAEAQIIYEGAHYHVFCPHCFAKACAASTVDEAIDRWNHRPENAVVPEEDEDDEPEELAPCPLCGGSVKLKKDFVAGADPCYFIQCENCKSNVGDIDRDELVRIWNERDDERSDALRSCPICGEPAEFWKDDDGWCVRCVVDQSGCGFCTPDFATKHEAMEFWNGETNE